jgi:ATP-binding cassette subfamily B protein
MKYHQQTGVNDCAPACLSMVASHYRSYLSIAEIRKVCKTDSMGTNLAGLVAAAEKFGFKAQAFKGEKIDKTLDSKVIFPFIAQIKIQYLGNTYDHFVVIKKITSKKVVIWDPNPAENRHSVDRANFLNIWTGYVLFLHPDTHFAPKKEKANILFKYAPLLFPYKKTLILVCIASVLLIFLGIITSFFYKYIVDEVLVTKAAFTLASLSIGVLLIVVFQTIIESMRTLLINHFVYKSDLQLDFSYITHVFKLPVSFFDSMRTGEILSRLTDISNIRDALSGAAFSLVMDTMLLIAVGPILFNINAMLFSIDVVNVLLISIIIFFFSKLYRRYYAKLRHEEAGVSSTIVEMINGAYTVKALNAEQLSFNRYEDSRMQAVRTSWKTSNTAIIQGLLTGIINGVTGILTFWIGSSGIINDTFSIGTLLSFNALAGYFTGPLFRLVNLQAGLQEAYVSAERVSEILEMEPEQTGEAVFLKPAALTGEIEFSHVAFRYGMRPPVYKDLSFHIGKGQWAAFVGPSGCGKTTLVKLLLKFYKPEEGAVSIDGRDLQDMDAAALRERIGYVPQEIYVFAGTIADNISLHNPSAPMEEIIAAAEKAGADEFISKLPERYNTRLSERGSTLSGGERQRLALARALLGKPDIMILDEATSNLDSVSERIIHQTIEKLRGTMTAVIIAHRLTTVRNCDIIFVMDQGAIVESGSHDALLAKNGMYKTLWEGTTV